MWAPAPGGRREVGRILARLEQCPPGALLRPRASELAGWPGRGNVTLQPGGMGGHLASALHQDQAGHQAKKHGAGNSSKATQ